MASVAADKVDEKVVPLELVTVKLLLAPVTAPETLIVPPEPALKLRLPPRVKFDRERFCPAPPPVAKLPVKVFVPTVVEVTPPVKR